MSADSERDGQVPGDGPGGRHPPEMLIVLQAGCARLGIDVRDVCEVTRAVPLSVPMSNAGAVVGMITLRGNSTAVIDLNTVLGVSCAPRDRRARMIAVRHNNTTVCLLVDQIDGLHNVATGGLDPPPSVLADVDVHWLDCVARSVLGELIGVIRVDRILSEVSLARTEEGKASA